MASFMCVNVKTGERIKIPAVKDSEGGNDISIFRWLLRGTNNFTICKERPKGWTISTVKQRVEGSDYNREA